MVAEFGWWLSAGEVRLEEMQKVVAVRAKIGE